MPRFRVAVLGGTFDHLHVGHHALLTTAFQLGNEVAIGLTTDRYVAAHPKPDGQRIEPFSTRRTVLSRWIRRSFPGRTYRVVPLEDAFGRSVEPGVGVLVVSADTLRGGRAVNRERRRLGRPPVPIVSVPLVLADDLEPVSSRRVRAGVIGTDGRRFTPIRVEVRASRGEDAAAAQRAVRRVFPQARTVVPPGPLGPEGGRADLGLRIARSRSGGWTATERSPRVRLKPRKIPGARPDELERGLVGLMRPRDKRKLFGTPRT